MRSATVLYWRLRDKSGIKSGIMGDTYQDQTTFRFRGKEYTLVRRGAGAPYSFRVQHMGRRLIRSTGKTDVSVARTKAKAMLAEILANDEAPKVERRRVPKIGEVVEAFKGGDQFVKRETANKYASCLRVIVRKAKGWTDEQIDASSISILSDTLLRSFQAKQQGRETVDFVEPMKENAWINSAVRQSRALFSRRAILEYEKRGWRMPDTLLGFMHHPILKEESHRYSDNPIPQEQIDAMNKALPDLKKKDARLWAIHLAIRLMGLRASEVAAAKRSWIVERDGTQFLVINRRAGDHIPKRSDGEVPIPPVLAEWFGEQSGEYLIPAKDKTERHTLIYREHSKWVGGFVTGRTKTNHELRKLAGSIVATKTNSWERAAEFLRIDLETAKRHYLAFTSPQEPLTPDDLQ